MLILRQVTLVAVSNPTDVRKALVSNISEDSAREGDAGTATTMLTRFRPSSFPTSWPLALAGFGFGTASRP